MSYKPHFARFLEAAPARLHFAAHSHHPWPDVTFDAHVAAWTDAARLADAKWAKIFGEVVPNAQRHVARWLGLRDGSSLAFAPNTHELLMRILSCLPHDRAVRVLTTDAEFHSFARQAARLEEDGAMHVTRVPAAPFDSFVTRFAEAAARPGWDLVYVSHTFFNSGWVVPDLARLARATTAGALLVVDGYHAFGALPVHLGEVQDRVFYLAGGYKYAMSGEGCCFLHAPGGLAERPRDTGWFAELGALAEAKTKGSVTYAAGGARFLGATIDPTPLYRFNAVMDWLEREQIDAARIHAHVHGLQELFIEELRRHELRLRDDQLVVPLREPSRGHFLTFETPAAAELNRRLLDVDVVTDVRGDRLRFGFGLYHDPEDIVRGVTRMRTALV